jgi:hypothetical protein
MMSEVLMMIYSNSNRLSARACNWAVRLDQECDTRTTSLRDPRQMHYFLPTLRISFASSEATIDRRQYIYIKTALNENEA